MTKIQIHDLIYGAAIGDALGNPVQFYPREKVKGHPVTDMIAGGFFKKPAGTWTDDTSMLLCLVASLAAKGTLDYTDVMIRFKNWLERADYTPEDYAFDVGQTCLEAIEKFVRGTPPLECGGSTEWKNGNGSLMRIAPLVFYLVKESEKHGGPALLFKDDWAFQIVHEVSSLTHAHPVACLGCSIYIRLLLEILRSSVDFTDTPDSRTVAKMLTSPVFEDITNFVSNHPEYHDAFSRYSRIFEPGFSALPEEEIESTGYVVHTLEAALWSFLTTTSFEDCLLKAVNLGHDADSVGAVAGAIAGLFYAASGSAIPERWLETVRGKDIINPLVKAFNMRFTTPADE